MKKLTNVCLLAWMWFALSQAVTAQTDPIRTQLNSIFANLNRSAIPAGVLREYGVELLDLAQFNGTATSSNEVNPAAWNMIYQTFYSARISGTQNLVDIEQVNSRVETDLRNNTAVITPIFFGEYDTLRADAVSQNLLRVQSNQLFDVAGRPESPYRTARVFAATPMRNFTEDGNFSLLFKSDQYYTNTTRTISSIQVDMADGQGFRTATFGTPVSATYTTTGTRIITIRVTLNNATTWQCYSSVQVLRAAATTSLRYNPLPTETVVIPARAGVHSGGRLQIAFSIRNPTGRIRRPFIVVEGFDISTVSQRLGNNYEYEDFVRAISRIPGYDFNDQLDNIGEYDLIFLDYTNGVDDVRRNAALLEEAIGIVNARKQANGSTQQNVVMGISMGGLVSRFCLASMTKRGINPQTRLLITQDSPHRGANIMLGLQHFLRILGDVNITFWKLRRIVPELDALINANDSDGARNQLLVRATDNNGGVAFNTFLDNEYRNMITFLPTDPQPAYRFVAVSQGAECGQGPLPAGAVVAGGSAEAYLRLFQGIIPSKRGFFFRGSINALPASGTIRICHFNLRYFTDLYGIIRVSIPLVNKSINSPSGILPWDSAAGGTESLEQRGGIGGGNFFGSFDWLIVGASFNGAVNQVDWCFVPTVSALDATTINVAALNSTYVGAVTPQIYMRSESFISQEPFNTPAGPRFNQGHTNFTARNARWIFNEMQGIANTINCSRVCLNNTLVEIEGPNTVSCGQTVNFSAPIISVTPNNYAWTLSNGLTLQSGQGTRTIGVRSSGQGATNGTINTTLQYVCEAGTGIVELVNTTLRPKIVTIEDAGITGTISYSGGSQTMQTVNFVPSTNMTVNVSAPGSNAFTWTQTSGSGVFFISNNGRTLSLTLSSGGSISFNLSTNSSCGFIQRTVTFVSSMGFYSFYPNPTSDNLNVEAIQDFEIEYQDEQGYLRRLQVKPGIERLNLYDSVGNLVRKQVLNSRIKNTSINLIGLRPGTYTIEVVNEGESFRQTIVKL